MNPLLNRDFLKELMPGRKHKTMRLKLQTLLFSESSSHIEAAKLFLTHKSSRWTDNLLRRCCFMYLGETHTSHDLFLDVWDGRHKPRLNKKDSRSIVESIKLRPTASALALLSVVGEGLNVDMNVRPEYPESVPAKLFLTAIDEPRREMIGQLFKPTVPTFQCRRTLPEPSGVTQS